MAPDLLGLNSGSVTAGTVSRAQLQCLCCPNCKMMMINSPYFIDIRIKLANTCKMLRKILNIV